MTNAHLIAIDSLLAAAVVVELIACLGALTMATTLQRLHFVGPAATVVPVLVALAVILAKHPYSGSGFKAGFIAVVMLALSPVLSHELARAASAREQSPPL